MKTRSYPPRRNAFAQSGCKAPPSPKAMPQLTAAEPEEREDPLNAALEAAEQLVRNIIAAGGEAPLRARLARLLPVTSEGERAA